MDLHLRPLKEEDALISYQWRNNPEIWKHTGTKPDRYITPDIEHEWIVRVLNNKKEKRLAICISDTNTYIGNVYLTDITSTDAEFHIFIGDTKYWNLGLGISATLLTIDYGFNKLKLNLIYLYVNKNHLKAISVYKKAGFIISKESNKDNMVKMLINTNKLYI